MLKLVQVSRSITGKPFARNGLRRFADWSGEREKGFENLDVRKHDEELMRKLRDSGPAKNVQTSTATAKTAAPTGNTAPRTPPQQYKEEYVSPITNRNSPVPMHEFLEFRKDMVNRLRELEDEIHELKSARFK